MSRNCHCSSSSTRSSSVKRLAGKPVAIFLHSCSACNGIHFCTFPAALFLLTRPLLSSSPLVPASLVSRPLSAALNARSARNENEPQKSFVRASVTFDIRAFFYTASRFSCEDFTVPEKETPEGREGGSRSSHAPASTEWRLSPKFLFLPLPFTFFHFSFTFLFSLFLLLFPFFSIGRFPFRHCALHHARLFSIFVCFFLFLASVCCRCIIRNNNRNFTESEIVINIPCNEHLSQSWV